MTKDTGGPAWNSDIKSAPFQKVIWVQNDLMEEPVMATRGFNTGTGIHPNNTFFTTVYTPHKYFPTPAGNLCCPNKWRHVENAEGSKP